MIPLKSKREIQIMAEGGKKLAWVFNQVLPEIKPGVTLSSLDKIAETLIEKQGGQSSFKMVKGYQWATCININQGVVHGIPGEYRVKKGDLVSLDMGMFYKGFHTDKAWTVGILNSKFLEAGKRALREAIKAAKPGNRIGYISQAVEKEIKNAGYHPIEALTGHGVGRNLHEEPPIPCFMREPIQKTAILKPGMTLAIEVIYTQGKPDLVLKNDGWTIETEDGKPAGLFEATIAINKKKPLILTDLN